MSGEADTLSDNCWPIPSSWQWARMAEVSRVIAGGTPSTLDSTNFDGGTIPWITPADLSGFSEKTISRGARSITQRGLDTSGAQLIPRGSVLLSSRAPIGYVAVAGSQLTTNQGFKSFALGPAVTSDYVYYYLHRAKEIALKMASGTTFLELSKKRAESLPIPVPPLPEQHRIVEAIETNFARLEAAAEGLSRAREDLKRYRAAVWRSALVGALVDLPPDTPRVCLFDAVDDLDGHRVPVNASTREGRVGDVPYYGATGQVGWIDDHLFDEELVLLGEDGVDFLDPLKPKSYVIHGKSWVNNHAHVLRAKTGVMISGFLETQLNATSYAGLVNGTTRLKLTKSAMRQIHVLAPPIAVQSRVLSEVDRLLSMGRDNEHRVSQAQSRMGSLREALLRTAFSGRLVPQDPSDEPASTLLERIRHERLSSSQPMTRRRKAVRAS